MNIQFQILDIGEDDVNFSYTITLYGRTNTNQNIVCNVLGFRPSFYVRLPNDHKKSDLINFKNILNKALKESLTSIVKRDIEKKTVKHPDFKKYLIDDSQEQADEYSDDENDSNSQVIGKSKDEEDYIKIFNGLLNSKLSFYTDPNNKNYCDMKIDRDIIHNKSFYHFSFDDNEKFKFYKLTFKTAFSMKKYMYAIKQYHNNCKEKIEKFDAVKDEYLLKWLSLKENNCDCEANLYESKVNPILKFIHETNINPCGWIKIPLRYGPISDNQPILKGKPSFSTDLQYDKINYKSIIPINDDNIQNFTICSFDIECDSSHGDFPNPKKDFKRLASEIYDYIIKEKIQSLMTLKHIQRCVEHAFKVKFYPTIKNDISEIYTFDKIYTNYDEIRIMISENENFKNGTFNEPKNRNKVINDLTKYFKNLKDSKGDLIEVEGDHVIQIGSVFHRYGEKEPYKRHIVVYKDGVTKKDDICSELNEFNIDVERCFTEKDLLLKWVEIITNENPDYITGYNIFGFDFSYIIDRVDILFPCPKDKYGKCLCKKYNKDIDHCKECPKHKFYKLGKMVSNEKNNNDHYSKRCKYVSKELSSSGLGDNELKFIHMDGRILFDMQKVIQKTII